MKIALLFSGRVDKFEEHYDNIRTSIIQDHDADVFLSTVTDEETMNRFRALYAPKGTINREVDYDPSYEHNRHPLANYHNMMCMYCHRMRVCDEMETYAASTNTVYAYVISIRLDAYFDEPLSYQVFLCGNESACQPDNKDVYIPAGNDWGGTNDQFAIGSMEAMRVYMRVYDEMKQWISEPNFGPEIVLGKHLNQHGMNVYRFPFRYRLINGKYYRHFSDLF
jgi:hypothetical protein